MIIFLLLLYKLSDKQISHLILTHTKSRLLIYSSKYGSIIPNAEPLRCPSVTAANCK